VAAAAFVLLFVASLSLARVRAAITKLMS
jgi:hypothetical protein